MGQKSSNQRLAVVSGVMAGQAMLELTFNVGE
jgi:hypothetical protein